tara:strand:+ start:13856 stop:14101 length:246 start_codon:yes stop_codon:yes gene_type:complete
MIEVEITNELYWLTYDEAQTAYTVGIAGAGSVLTANHDFLILKTTVEEIIAKGDELGFDIQASEFETEEPEVDGELVDSGE